MSNDNDNKFISRNMYTGSGSRKPITYRYRFRYLALLLYDLYLRCWGYGLRQPL